MRDIFADGSFFKLVFKLVVFGKQKSGASMLDAPLYDNVFEIY